MMRVSARIALLAVCMAAVACAVSTHESAHAHGARDNVDPTPSTDSPYTMVAIKAIGPPTESVALSLRYDPTIKGAPRYLDAFVQRDGNNRDVLTVQDPATTPTFPNVPFPLATPQGGWSQEEFGVGMRTAFPVHSLTDDTVFYTPSHIFQWSGQGTTPAALNTEPFVVEFVVPSKLTANMAYAFQKQSDSTGAARRVTTAPGAAPAWHGDGLTIISPKVAIEFGNNVVVGGLSNGNSMAMFIDVQTWTHDSTMDVIFQQPGDTMVSIFVETANTNYPDGLAVITWKDGAVGLIDLSTRKEVVTNFRVPLETDERITGAAFDATGNYAFYGTGDGRVYKVPMAGFTPIFSVALDERYSLSNDPVYDIDGTIYFGLASQEITPGIAVLHADKFCPNDCPDQDCQQGQCMPLPTISPLKTLEHPGNAGAIAGLVVMSFVLSLMGAGTLVYAVWRSSKAGAFAPNIA